VCILVGFLIKVLKDIEVESRITNGSRNSEVLRLNHVVILLHFIVRRCASLSKNSICAKVSPQKLKLMQKSKILWNCVVCSWILLSLKLFARSYEDGKELENVIKDHPVTWS
jgi:hypothetical protein